jgi:aspartate/methionine/tyrosine aminotransferase
MYSSPSTSVNLTAENVVTMPGSAMANFLGLGGIAGRGEHVVVQYPTFSQLYDVLRFNGVEVTFWRPKSVWEWSVEDLEALVRKETRAVVIKYVFPFLSDFY